MCGKVGRREEKPDADLMVGVTVGKAKARLIHGSDTTHWARETRSAGSGIRWMMIGSLYDQRTESHLALMIGPEEPHRASQK